MGQLRARRSVALLAELVNVFYKKGVASLLRFREMTFPVLTFKKMTPGTFQIGLRMYQQDRQYIKEY
jgi:hypothetical protein